jgi:hypothetical protein
MDLKQELIRSGTQITLATIAGAALQPVITRPEVITVAAQYAQALVIVGGTAGLVLIAGRAAAQLQRWNRLLPPPVEAPAPAVFAYSPPPAPGYVGTNLDQQRRLSDALRRIDHDEQQATDRDQRVRALIVRFALLASQFPGARFSWRWCCKFMSRHDWTQCLGTVVRMGAVRPARGNEPPAWASGWYYSRFRIAVQYEGIPVPYPESETLPEFRRVY